MAVKSIKCDQKAEVVNPTRLQLNCEKDDAYETAFAQVRQQMG